jgi:4-amino-4-deoxy-L-arabinose transferase-like glycosyltransferase
MTSSNQAARPAFHDASQSLSVVAAQHNSPWEAKWLLWIGCGLRIAFFFFSQKNGGDAFARAALTAGWLQHPSLNLDFGGPTWPPLHFWLMALVAQIVPDASLACRLLSLIAGLISLWLFWKFASRLYGDSAATLSLAIFVFYSLHIAYSTTSSSEETFVAFLLSGLLGVFSFRSSGRYSALAAGGLSLTAAAAIRFEAWVLIIGLGFIFLAGQNGRPFPHTRYWKKLLAFGVTSGAWPVFWMIHEWSLTGHPFYALVWQQKNVPTQLAVYPSHSWLYELALPPGVMLLTLTPIAVGSALYGVYFSCRDRKSRAFTFLVLFFGLSQLAAIATHGNIAMARYTVTLGTLCSLLAGHGLTELGKRLLPTWHAALPAVLTAVLAANLAFILILSECPGPFEDKFRSISPLMQFPIHIEGAGKFLKPMMRPEDRVVIDSFNEESNLLGVVAGLPLLPGDRAFIPSDRNGGDPFPYLNSYHPRFAILAELGIIGSRLRLPPTCSGSWIVRGMEFNCVYENEIYRIYEIYYTSSSLSAARQVNLQMPNGNNSH